MTRTRSFIPRPLAITLALIAVLIPAKSFAEAIISTLSTGQIQIASNFDGAEIVVFGAIERDGITVARGGYDVVITVSGPPERLVARRKERVVGLWINQASRNYGSLPSFHTILANRPLEDISTPQLLERYQIGFLSLPILNASTREGTTVPTAESQKFADAVVRIKKRDRLYLLQEDGVTFLTENLFRARINIPSNVPVGTYKVKVHLFSDGAQLATDIKPFQISKVGFERAMYDLSQQQGVLYGIATVLAALFTGWLAGLVFRRD